MVTLSSAVGFRSIWGIDRGEADTGQRGFSGVEGECEPVRTFCPLLGHEAGMPNGEMRDGPIGIAAP